MPGHKNANQKESNEVGQTARRERVRLVRDFCHNASFFPQHRHGSTAFGHENGLFRRFHLHPGTGKYSRLRIAPGSGENKEIVRDLVPCLSVTDSISHCRRFGKGHSTGTMLRRGSTAQSGESRVTVESATRPGQDSQMRWSSRIILRQPPSLLSDQSGRGAISSMRYSSPMALRRS